MKDRKKLKILIVAIIIAISSIFVYKGAIAPKLYDKYLNTGIKYLMESQYEEAILAFDKAIKIESKTTEARVYQAKAYVGNEEFDNAVEVLEQAQNIDKTNEELLKEIIDILIDIDSDIAYEFLERFIEAVGKDNISQEIKDMLKSANEMPSEAKANPEPGTYVEEISVELKFDKKKVGHSYYYTLDGSIPDKNSTKYRGKIDISESTTIKVVGYNRNNKSTNIITLEYIIDKNILQEVENIINEGQTLIDETEIGVEVGNIVKEDKDKFKFIIDEAKESIKDTISYDEINELKNKVENGISDFKNNIIKPTDKSKLNSAISDAQKLYNNSAEGSSAGQYKSGSKVVLLEAINKAQQTYDNKVAKQSEIDQQVSLLKNQINKFESSKNKDLSQLKNKYINRVKTLERKVQHIADGAWDIYSNAEMGDALYDIYAEYENLLNDMNSELERNLSQSELSTLNGLKNRWIKDKAQVEQDFSDTVSSVGMGMWMVTGEMNMYIEAINKHCYRVINTLMN